MKSFVVLIALLAASSAVAQSPQQLAALLEQRRGGGAGQKGFYMGVEALTFSKLKLRSKAANGDTQISDALEAGGSLRMAGLGFGYVQTPEVGIGFSAGSRLLRAVQSPGNGEQPVMMVAPEANLTVGLGQAFAAYLGVNGAFFAGNETFSRFMPDLGAQAGIVLRFTPSVVVNAGYTVARQRLTEKDSSGTTDLHLECGGFGGALNYVF